MRTAFWLVPAIALPVVLLAADPQRQTEKKQDKRPTIEEIRARYTPEKLARIRASMAARIAVIDQAEQGRRAATPEEAAALAPVPGPGTAAAARTLKNGGTALKGDAASLDYSVATIESGGTVSRTHRAAPPAAKARKQEAGNEKH